MIKRDDRYEAEQHAFLGEEFLTWLWFQLETDGGEFDLDEHGTVGVMLDDMIMFAARDDDETEQTLRKGRPTRCAEAATALRGGRRLKRAKLILAQGRDEWTVTVDAASMNLLSIKLPPDDEEATSFVERSRARMHNFLLLHDLVAGLYRAFLRTRLQDDYLETAAKRQASWATARS